MTRRQFLGDLGVGVGAAAVGGGLISACATSTLAPAPVASRAPDRAGPDNVVRFANWPYYIDAAPGQPRQHPTLAEFTRETGIAVDYSEPITSNERFVGRIGIPLALGGDTGYDLVVLADWMVAELVRLGWAQPLRPGLLPNRRRLLPSLRNWPLHDVSRYSLPWQAALGGIGYNLSRTHRPVTSMTELLTAPDLHGRVSLVQDMRDVMGLILLDLGADPSDFSPAEFAAGIRVLRRAVSSGQVKLVSDYYYDELAKGTVAAGVAWAGDVLYVRDRAPDVGFTWPAGGGILSTYNMVVPATARHRADAERLMNFYYEPRPAAQLAAFNRYVCPVEGAQAAMAQVAPALVTQKYIFPPPRLLRTGHFFKILSPSQSAAYTGAYEQAVGL